MKKINKLLKAIFISPVVFILELIAVVILGAGSLIYFIAAILKDYRLAKKLIKNYFK